jgi:hypothetical protein
MAKLRKIMEKKNRYDKNRKINGTLIEEKQTGPNEDKRNTGVKWKKVR